MALKGSKKDLSERHEREIAGSYRGRRSESSGGAVTDDGDVITQSELIECKGQFGELTGNKPVRSTLLTQFTKIAEEAYQQLRDPVIALRFYAPDSLLANENGYVDFTVRLTADDLRRTATIDQYYEVIG